MTTAELLGKVAQKCYEINSETNIKAKFEFDGKDNWFSVYTLAGFEMEDVYSGHVTNYSLKHALKKLLNIQRTYRELVE